MRGSASGLQIRRNWCAHSGRIELARVRRQALGILCRGGRWSGGAEHKRRGDLHMLAIRIRAGRHTLCLRRRALCCGGCSVRRGISGCRRRGFRLIQSLLGGLPRWRRASALLPDGSVHLIQLAGMKQQLIGSLHLIRPVADQF